jgi:hypothetical protein
VGTIEAKMPRVTFEAWLRDLVGDKPAITWEVNDCGEQTGSPADRGHAAVRQYEAGHKTPGLDALVNLADALDATTDYLLGRGEAYGGENRKAYVRAASHISFDVFAKDLTVTQDQRDRCRRVLAHEDAPRTASRWRSFAEMLDLALGPPPPRFEVLSGRK